MRASPEWKLPRLSHKGWEGGAPRARRDGLAWGRLPSSSLALRGSATPARPRPHHDKIAPQEGLLPCSCSRCAGGRRRPRVSPDLSKQENTRVLKGSETFTSQSYLQGGRDTSKGLKDKSCWPSGSRHFNAVLAAHRNSLSCLFRGLLDDLRERAVLYQQQLGFCSGTATIRDTKY